MRLPSIQIRSAWIALLAVFLTAGAYGQDSRYVRVDPSKGTAIVFVHGVTGDSIATWTNEATKAYWPSLVADDPAFNGASVYVFQYPSPIVGRAHSINELAEVMRRRLQADGVVEHKEIVLVSHSMGGLVTRAFLLKYRDYAAQVRFAYFLATPTEGSPYAALVSLASGNPQFKRMYPLQTDNYLADLQRDWLAARLKIKSFCAYEGRDTFGLRIVDQRSATNLCTEPLDPILENHINIAKPANRQSDSYIALKNAFQSSRKSTVLPVPSSEVASLLAYFDARAEKILSELDAAIATWQHKSDDKSRRSIQVAMKKKEQFRAVHVRHQEAIRNGQLTLAAVLRQEVNGVLAGEKIFYNTGPLHTELVPDTTYEMPKRLFESQRAEVVSLLHDPTMSAQTKQAAAVTILRGCPPISECISAFASILESDGAVYIHWQAAAQRICAFDGDKSSATSAVLRVLSDRVKYSDWRLWIFSMNVAGCIGKPAAEAIPSIIGVIERTNLKQGEYYNTEYIRQQAADAIYQIGIPAREALPALRSLLASNEAGTVAAAKKAIQVVER
jgi:pimeloyl-ACP methyl ester carboxylesterase